MIKQLYEVGQLVMSSHDSCVLEKDALLLMLLFTHGINGSSVPGKVHDVDNVFEKASRAHCATTFGWHRNLVRLKT